MTSRFDDVQKAAAERGDVIGLAGGLPANELLPREDLAQALATVATDNDTALQYGWPEGAPELRAWVAERLAARGAPIDPERIIITAGAQQALAIIADLLGARRITVGPATYQGALQAFGERAVVAGTDVRYVMAGVANPEGTPQAPSAELLASARELIVDEAYSELCFDGHVLPPIVGDAPDRVWHVGTISKTIAPGLRVGWLIPPPDQHAAALDKKHAADLQTASVSQAALVRLLATVDYDDLVTRARTEYARRATALVEALHRHAPGLRFREPSGAFSIWIETDERARGDADELALLETLLAEGVMVDPGRLFRAEPTDAIAVRLCYSNAPVESFDEGVRRIVRGLRRWRRQAA